MKIVTNQAIEDMILEQDPDGVDRFPSYYHVVCFDNFNTLDANTPEEETKRLSANKPASRKLHTTFEGFMENGLLQDELSELTSYLGEFRSAVYVRTAQASRWNLPKEVDDITDEIVKRGTDFKVTSIRGEWFWNSIVQYATPESNQWHHAHNQGNDRFLHHHWDRMRFRIISFSKVCTIHPGTLEYICDTKAYESVYEEIKREEGLDRPPQPGDSSSSGLHVDTKVEDVLPTSYQRALLTVSLMVPLMVPRVLERLSRGVGLMLLLNKQNRRVKPMTIFPMRKNSSILMLKLGRTRKLPNVVWINSPRLLRR